MSTTKNDEISAEMLEGIAVRLRPACPDIPEVEFQRLVLDVARTKVKNGYDRFACLAALGSLPNKGRAGIT
jgi:hypothetical protein